MEFFLLVSILILSYMKLLVEKNVLDLQTGKLHGDLSIKANFLSQTV